MSWTEDEGIDGWEPPDPPDERDIRNPDLWVDSQGIESFWHELEPEHIRRIIVGLRNGKSYLGQEHKLERAEKEYANMLALEDKNGDSNDG